MNRHPPFHALPHPLRNAAAVAIALALGLFTMAAAQACGDPAEELDRAFAQVDISQVNSVVVTLPVDDSKGGEKAALEHAKALREQLERRGVAANHIFFENRGSGDMRCATVSQR